MLNNLPRLFLGPLSINIIKAVCSYNGSVGLIASRRQIDCLKGYVNNFTDYEFKTFVKNLNNSIIIARDHGGPSQGLNDDDGFNSLYFDALNFDLIHVDVWRTYKNIELAAIKTAEYIQYCENIKGNWYEVGTEQDIREYTHEDLKKFLDILNFELRETFKKIVFGVIQSGTSLKKGKNYGIYDESRLVEMVKICKAFGLKSKEHNGDYLDPNLIRQKFSIGLDAINIAPELGGIETKIVLKTLNSEEKNIFFNLCLQSNKWQRWLGKDLDTNSNKDLIMHTCGHYVFSHKDFRNLIKGKEHIIQNDTCTEIQELINGIIQT